MAKSSLEVYVQILTVLSRYGTLKVSHVMYETVRCHKDVKQRLELLVKQNLVTESTLVGRKRKFYDINEGGIALLESLNTLES